MSTRFRSRRVLYLLRGGVLSTVFSYHENLPRLLIAMIGLSLKRMTNYSSTKLSLKNVDVETGWS